MSFNALGNFVKNVFLFWLKVTFLFFLKLCNFSYTKVNVMLYASSFLLRMIVSFIHNCKQDHSLRFPNLHQMNVILHLQSEVESLPVLIV